MTDLALRFAEDALSADLAILGGDLATEAGLRTAVIISLFTDARARDDDVLPQEGGDRRGWWGDGFADDPADETGSRLWLLSRAKVMDATAIRARDHGRAALAWMVADGIAAGVEVDCTLFRPTTRAPTGAMLLHVEIIRPTGARLALSILWDAEANRILSTETQAS